MKRTKLPKFNAELAIELNEIVKKYSLTTSSNNVDRSISKITDFVENNARNIEVLKSYLEFLKKSPFALNEPVRDSLGNVYLVSTLFQDTDSDGNAKWTDAEIVDKNGKIVRVKLDVLSKYSESRQ